MENLNRISYGLRNGLYNTNPHDCANDLAVLAGEYAFIMGRLEEILQRKPAVWTEMRVKFESDKACERAWEGTGDGLSESSLRLQAKSVEKMMSALKSLLRLAEDESKNLH
jgi:conjugal transfer/entry exclusion protein